MESQAALDPFVGLLRAMTKVAALHLTLNHLFIKYISVESIQDYNKMITIEIE